MSSVVVSLVLLIVFSGATFAFDYPGVGLDRFSVRAMRTVHSAEITYFALNGNNFGTLTILGEAALIDPALASGNKYGHLFVVSLTPSTPTSPAGFTLTATPRAYRKVGRWSFFIDESGQVHGADKHGELATAADPIISEPVEVSIAENERRTISNTRTLHSAEVTWFATSGMNTNYTDLAGLFTAGLISSNLASGQLNGYSISVVALPQTPTAPARYRANAVPQTYGTTGIRSFFVNENGVIYGADHQGGPASENDPPI